MIVCSCNVLTSEQILATLEAAADDRPLNAKQVYHCLGCAPQCGRCLVNIRALLETAQVSCTVGCNVCPGQHRGGKITEKDDFRLAAE